MKTELKKELVEAGLLRRVHRKAFRGSINIHTGNMKEELPKKWAVKRTCNNSEILNDWNNNHYLFKEQHRINAESICDEDYFYDDQAHTAKLQPGYTEITFEQFQEHILGIKPVSNTSEDLSYLIDFLKQQQIT